MRLGQRVDAQRVPDEGRRHARARRGADAAVDQVPVGRHVRAVDLEGKHNVRVCAARHGIDKLLPRNLDGRAHGFRGNDGIDGIGGRTVLPHSHRRGKATKRPLTARQRADNDAIDAWKRDAGDERDARARIEKSENEIQQRNNEGKNRVLLRLQLIAIASE